MLAAKHRRSRPHTTSFRTALSADAERVALIRSIEELIHLAPLINRTRRRDIGEFTMRKAETVTIDFTPEQSRLHDGLLDVIAGILRRCHGQQNVKFMMTTIRRQAASCLYRLAPMLSDILAGKMDRLEAMEASDSDAEVDLSFLGGLRKDIEDLIDQASSLDEPRAALISGATRLGTLRDAI
jgi:ATP-dependent helicase HepA